MSEANAMSNKEWKPQAEDYFTLTGVGYTSGGLVPPEMKTTTLTTEYLTTLGTFPTYATYYNGTLTVVTYSFMYWDGVAFPSPITGGVPFIGAFAVNGLNLVIDQVVITNNYSTSITIDLLKASPANIVENGRNTIPPVQLARYTVGTGATVSLNKDDIDIKLKNFVPQTETLPYYMTGYGLALAFPASVTVGTLGTSTYTNYGVTNVNVTAEAHFSP